MQQLSHQHGLLQQQVQQRRQQFGSQRRNPKACDTRLAEELKQEKQRAAARVAEAPRVATPDVYMSTVLRSCLWSHTYNSICVSRGHMQIHLRVSPFLGW